MTIVLFIFGIAIGSFLNMVSSRYPSRQYGGRSRCDHCHTPLRWYELIPLISYLALGGRCRTCKKPINPQNPIVELASGVLFAAMPPFLFLVAGYALILIGAIDARLGIIPDGLNLFLTALGVVAIILAPALWLDHLLGGALGFGLLGAIAFLSKGSAMGGGDVKLAGALGLLFGWQGILFTLASAFIFGGIWAAILLAVRTKSLKDTVAFGPFIALGGFIMIFFGDMLMRIYF